MFKLNTITCGLIAAAIAAAPTHASAQTAPTTAPAVLGPSGFVETKPQKDTRMQWWREARFGMFIHWGLYAVPAGVYKGQNVPSLGEWIMNNGNIPVADYAKFADQFNPQKFNADQFVKIAHDAGMKYIVITAKHHDGFAMFKSADPFNVVDATPFKRDIIKELDDAARKAGMRFGVYYSQSQDWHHPGGYALGRNSRPNGTHWDPAAQDDSFDDYLKNVAVPQTRELLTNYKLDVLWWDTPGSITLAEATPLHDLLKLQPNIVSNNRLAAAKAAPQLIGDTETPEQKIPATGYPGGRDWESCMTINDTWGFKSTDTKWKSTETLLRNLIDIASKGGNYLLNVGPTAEGEIPGPEMERLAAMGKWLQINGEAIYGTGPNPFPAPVAAITPANGPATTRAATPAVVWDWRATTKLNADGSGKIYIHIFQWPPLTAASVPASASFPLPQMPGTMKVTKAYLLGNPTQEVAVFRFQNGLLTSTTLLLPEKAPDPIASVVCLEVSAK